MAKHQPDRLNKEVPRTQTHAQRPSLKQLFSGTRACNHALLLAHRRYGYRMREIGECLDVHCATVEPASQAG